MTAMRNTLLIGAALALAFVVGFVSGRWSAGGSAPDSGGDVPAAPRGESGAAAPRTSETIAVLPCVDVEKLKGDRYDSEFLELCSEITEDVALALTRHPLVEVVPPSVLDGPWKAAQKRAGQTAFPDARAVGKEQGVQTFLVSKTYTKYFDAGPNRLGVRAQGYEVELIEVPGGWFSGRRGTSKGSAHARMQTERRAEFEWQRPSPRWSFLG